MTIFSQFNRPSPLSLHAPSLREWMLSKQTPTAAKAPTTIPKRFKIVDVRDDDYFGGHIAGALNIPSHDFPSRVASLVEELKDYDAVVFHCALSQQRGPHAAKKYLALLNKAGKANGQKVYLLKGGFVYWQVLPYY
jgi:rhodanese-related sulfurtransferase